MGLPYLLSTIFLFFFINVKLYFLSEELLIFATAILFVLIVNFGIRKFISFKTFIRAWSVFSNFFYYYFKDNSVIIKLLSIYFALKEFNKKIIFSNTSLYFSKNKQFFLRRRLINQRILEKINKSRKLAPSKKNNKPNQPW